jgi:hypothetical protein
MPRYGLPSHILAENCDFFAQDGLHFLANIRKTYARNGEGQLIRQVTQNMQGG